MNSNNPNNRRDFLKALGLVSIPAAFPAMAVAGLPAGNRQPKDSTSPLAINFITDGLWFSPQQYLEKLQEINEQHKIEGDYYGKGGPTSELEIEFAKVTGKEKAVYFPSGTMANQLAMKMLNNGKTKVIVPENSHIFRDEGDAAQSVHELRLIPLGKGKPHYDLEDLKASIAYSSKNEHYNSGLGTVVVENPIRRNQNTFVPIETLRQISAYCRKKGYKLHLDGARLQIAATYSGVSVKEYASLFDTVYISLYKYLNASGGAMLAGDAQLMEKMEHQIKILGGSILRNWAVTAMALHYLPGIEERWKQVAKKAEDLITRLNKLKEVQISSIANGTNSYVIKLDESINKKLLADTLIYEFNILWVERRNEKGELQFTVNETLLMEGNDSIVKAWESSLKKSRT